MTFGIKNYAMGRKIIIEDLIERSNRIAWSVGEELRNTDAKKLLEKPSPDSWCVIEVVEHLNRTFDHYFPKLERAVEKAPPAENETYKRSFLVGFFSDSMKPKKGKRKMKMKTFEFFEPHINGDTRQVIDEFLENQEQFNRFIKAGRDRDISKVKVVSAAGPLLKFRLPECFEFLLSHEERHLLQMKEILAAIA